MNIVYGLWCICHPERGIRYAGQTSRGWKARWGLHKAGARRGDPWPSSRWIRKHGAENIRVVILAQIPEHSGLNDLEIWWIDFLRSNGQADLNVTGGGGGLRGTKRSEETRRKMSESSRGRTHSEKTKRILATYRGVKASFYGKHHTDENKMKTNSNHPGRKLTVDKVREIRRRYESGESPKRIAADFGITSSNVVQHGKRQTWKWLKDEN